MENPLLHVSNVTKRFGANTAVDNLSLSVSPGEIHAVLGANGAGKTTLVRMLIGLTDPDSGSIQFRMNGQQSRRMPSAALGYLPEERGLYLDRSPLDSLVYLARLRGASRASARKMSLRWLERMDLSERANDKLQTLSKGNQQKVQLIAAVSHEPSFVIMDEPFSGFDPINQERVIDLLLDLKSMGTTILLSAHQLTLVERLADRLTLMNQGACILAGSLTDILRESDSAKVLTVQWTNPMQEDLGHLPGVASVDRPSDLEAILQLSDDADLNATLLSVSQTGAIAHLSAKKRNLHDVYLKSVEANS